MNKFSQVLVIKIPKKIFFDQKKNHYKTLQIWLWRVWTDFEESILIFLKEKLDSPTQFEGLIIIFSDMILKYKFKNMLIYTQATYNANISW